MDEKTQRKLIHAGQRKNATKVKEIISALEDMVNSDSFSSKPVIETIKNDGKGMSNLVQFCYEWVNYWDNAGDSKTDDRNADSTELCKAIAGALKEKHGCVTETEFFNISMPMAGMHRELVQNATSLVASTLSAYDETVKEVIKSAFEKGDIHMSYE